MKIINFSFSLLLTVGNCLFLRVENRVRTQVSLQSQSEYIYDDISIYKAKELKQILQASNINTKSFFEKRELEEALNKQLKVWINNYNTNVNTIPLQITQYGSPPKDYTSIKIKINNNILDFIIDSGSSINIMKSNIYTTLNADTITTPPVYTSGVGGGGSVSSTNSNEIKMLPIQIGANEIEYSLPFVLLDKMQFFPANIAGILGIQFLETISNGNDYGINLNYEKKLFEFGNMNGLLSPVMNWKSKKIKLKRIPPGLITCNVYLTSTKTKETVLCQGLVDLGSASSILNVAAVKAMREDPILLEASPLTSIGIDNRPMRMKTLNIDQYVIGDIPSKTTTSSSTIMKSSVTSNLNILVSDIPAFNSIGLHDKPALILGQDLLRKSSNIQSHDDTNKNTKTIENNNNKNQILFDLSNNHIYIPQ